MNYQDIIDKPVSELHARKLLSTSFERSIFLNEYKYFGKDDNKSLYEDFIIKTLSRRRTNSDLLTDVIYLAIEIKFFSKEVLDRVSKILLSRRNYLTKLACLDYFNVFRKRIDRTVYLKMNHTILSRSRNTLLRGQSLINLIPLDRDNYFSMLIEILKNEIVPTMFYRVFSGVKAGNLRLNSRDRQLVAGIIKRKDFDKKVKSELVMY